MSSPSCLAPWYHAFVHSDGTLRPCGVSWDRIGSRYKGDTPESVWNSQNYLQLRQSFLENQKPSGCKSCWHKETQGIRSRRHVLNEELARLTGLPLETMGQNLSLRAENRIVSLDMSLGKTCNLRCRFCGPYNSTKWRKDAETLLTRDPSFWEPIFGSLSPEPDKAAPPAKNAAELVPDSSHLQLLEIKGGEPFSMPEHLELLETLVRRGQAARLHLVYATNGTVIQPEVRDLFPRFRSVYLNISTEGTGELYRYLRGERFGLETDVEPHMRFYNGIPNLTLNVHFTLCAYNVFGIGDFLRWYERLDLQALQRKGGGWTLGLVAFPMPLRLTTLPRKMRQDALLRLEGFSGPHLHTLRQALSHSDESSLADFLNYTQQLDALRGTRLLDVVPEFAPLFS